MYNLTFWASSSRRKLELVDQYGFVSKLGEKLSIFDMTMTTYNALFEVSLICKYCMYYMYMWIFL